MEHRQHRVGCGTRQKVSRPFQDVGLDVFVGDTFRLRIGLTEVTARADTMARTDVAMRTCDAYRWCRERWTNCHFPPTG